MAIGNEEKLWPNRQAMSNVRRRDRPGLQRRGILVFLWTLDSMLKDDSALLVKTEHKRAYVRFTLAAPGIAREAPPGQFVMGKVSETGHPLLRRPLGIHARSETTISLFFNVAGLGTALLAQKREGDRLDLLGPLGRGFTVGRPGGGGGPVLLVGGGPGVAPPSFLVEGPH